jgi:N-acetylmuramoyl-L-alanine amidase
MWSRLLFIYLVCLPQFLIANDPVGYLQITANAGDGIYSLMRRYQLDQYSCNFQKFYQLNDVKRNAPLREGKKYYLPIFIYSFNGQNIRSSIGVDNWDLAIGIQKYNETMLSDGLRKESFQQSRLLWVPFHSFNCANPDLNIKAPEPVNSASFDKISNPSSRNFPIFGREYAETPLQSNRLQGEIFYLVSGHGGPDPGAVGKRSGSTLCEDEYAYDVALRLCRKLIEQGATAYMVTRDPNDGIRNDQILRCDEDEIVWGGLPVPRPHKERLHQRSNVINELYEQNRELGFSKQKTIVIHVDSRSKNERIDLFFYHQTRSEASKVLATQLHNTMKQKYLQYRKTGSYAGTVKTRDLHMLREVKPTTVYVELANIRNKTDQQRIILASNRQALADWLYEGLIK